MGLVTVTLLPGNKSMRSRSDKPVLIKGTKFTAKLQITTPATAPNMPPDPPTPKPGTAEFITTTVKAKAR